MKVLLRRNLFLGGSRYRQNSLGTEIPDSVDNKTVVLHPSVTGKPLGKDEIALPKEITLFDEKKPRVILKGELLKGTEKPKPTALSELPKQLSNEELLEKKK
jgi:hypothetical protein